mmetsp:Transcript_84086/g.238330  ORF Transcript_84086/g.238330 Transcript_84086/m.238330 type:complete len:207 (-) Transcript_84086:2648-3268(-)
MPALLIITCTPPCSAPDWLGSAGAAEEAVNVSATAAFSHVRRCLSSPLLVAKLRPHTHECGFTSAAVIEPFSSTVDNDTPPCSKIADCGSGHSFTDDDGSVGPVSKPADIVGSNDAREKENPRSIPTMSIFASPRPKFSITNLRAALTSWLPCSTAMRPTSSSIAMLPPSSRVLILAFGFEPRPLLVLLPLLEDAITTTEPRVGLK